MSEFDKALLDYHVRRMERWGLWISLPEYKTMWWYA